MTIGIQGSWGTENFPLNMIEDQIELDNKSKNFVHIKINAGTFFIVRPEKHYLKL